MVKWLVWINVLLFACDGFAADDLAQRVVIVYNAQEPESKPLAEYYAQKRGVPTNQICAINMRPVETITRREYNDNIREPLLRFLTRQRLIVQQARTVNDPELGPIPWIDTVDSRVSYVVLMYGVPLRIDRDPTLHEKPQPPDLPETLRRNEASVESELSLLPTMGTPAMGPLRNWFFGNESAHLDAPLNHGMLLVGRLDAPDAPTVRRMIDDALAVERYGLHGRAYFDAQGTTDKGYIQGDDWIRGAYQFVREAGYECDYDDRKEIFGEDYPMTDAAIYAGWYAEHASGPFRRTGFRFRTGAIAYHIHSASGASVRSRTTYWVGPLLDRGAAATMGNVFEPYLQYTPHVDMFFKRLLAGGIFIEAGYYSQPVLSWQTTFVGDPLYRPFRLSLDEQIARLETDKRPELEWAYSRKVNLLLRANQPDDAEKLCRAKAEALKSVVLYEKLGDLLHAAHREGEAVEAYNKAAVAGDDSYRYIRVATKLAGAYEANKQPGLALAIYEGLIGTYSSHKNAVEFFKKARDLANATDDEAKAKTFQKKIDELIRAEKK
jgi:uncharacterized protein (TIGR03790 family)